MKYRMKYVEDFLSASSHWAKKKTRKGRHYARHYEWIADRSEVNPNPPKFVPPSLGEPGFMLP